MIKKIIIASNTSWSLFNFRLELARNIKKNGYKVIFIAPYDEYSERLSKEFEYHDIYINNKGINPIEDIRTIIAFYKIYKEIRPDIVLNFTIKPNIYGTIVCDLLNIRAINNITGLGALFVERNFITKVAKGLYKYSQTKANKIFFQNIDDFKLFTSENLVDQVLCDILPGSGVDTSKFSTVEQEKKSDRFVFLLIARMLWEKGIGEYVEAAKIIQEKYKNVEFQLLGFLNVKNNSAISENQMKEWVSKGLVSYLGVSDNTKEEIAEADCIVLPSFYREGTPRALLEGASMAKPIITTDYVGCRDVVDNGINGYLCKIRSSQDLADKMEMMLNLSEPDRKVMGKKSREKMIRQFDEKIVIDKYLDSIKEIG